MCVCVCVCVHNLQESAVGGVSSALGGIGGGFGGGGVEGAKLQEQMAEMQVNMSVVGLF